VEACPNSSPSKVRFNPDEPNLRFLGLKLRPLLLFMLARRLMCDPMYVIHKVMIITSLRDPKSSLEFKISM
jgi:hypothetical protein